MTAALIFLWAFVGAVVLGMATPLLALWLVERLAARVGKNAPDRT